jgi:hypothetical protein
LLTSSFKKEEKEMQSCITPQEVKAAILIVGFVSLFGGTFFGYHLGKGSKKPVDPRLALIERGDRKT